MRATDPLRPDGAARAASPAGPDGAFETAPKAAGTTVTRDDDHAPKSGLPAHGALPALAPVTQPGRRLVRYLTTVLVLAVLWGVLTGWQLDAWVMGAPAVLLGAGLGLLLPSGPRWRLSPRGALVFLAWFAIQSVRGAIDVSRRAFSPAMPLRPGFRTHPLRLPRGPARVLFINTITMLPGTLSAEVRGDTLVVHMLDTRADLAAELEALEARIRALFALHPTSSPSEAP